MLVEFYIGDDLNLEVVFYIEDGRKAVERTLNNNMLAFVGPKLKIQDSDEGQEIIVALSLSEQILTDKDKNSKCTNYPNKLYKSYKDCDKEFLMKQMKDLNITPFWATRDLDQVTNQRQYSV